MELPRQQVRKISADDIIFRRRRSSAIKMERDLQKLQQKVQNLSKARQKDDPSQFKDKQSYCNSNHVSGLSSNKISLNTPLIKIQQPSVDLGGFKAMGKTEEWSYHPGATSGERDNHFSSNNYSKETQDGKDVKNQSRFNDKNTERTGSWNFSSGASADSSRRNSQQSSPHHHMIKNSSPRRSADNILLCRRKSTNELLNIKDISPTRKRNSADSIFNSPRDRNGAQQWDNNAKHMDIYDTGKRGGNNYDNKMRSMDQWLANYGRYELPLSVFDSVYDNFSDSNLQAAAARASLKRNGRRRCSEPMRPPPPCPPSPALQHLNSDELKKLNKVIQRQEQFEQEECSRTE